VAIFIHFLVAEFLLSLHFPGALPRNEICPSQLPPPKQKPLAIKFMTIFFPPLLPTVPKSRGNNDTCQLPALLSQWGTLVWNLYLGNYTEEGAGTFTKNRASDILLSIQLRHFNFIRADIIEFYCCCSEMISAYYNRNVWAIRSSITSTENMKFFYQANEEFK
jgi:hypothetical protein